MPNRMTLVAVWLVLLALLGISTWVALLRLGSWHAALNLIFAVASAGAVVWFDMHLRKGSGTLKLFAGGTVIFLFIMFGFGLADWLTR